MQCFSTCVECFATFSFKPTVTDNTLQGRVSIQTCLLRNASFRVSEFLWSNAASVEINNISSQVSYLFSQLLSLKSPLDVFKFLYQILTEFRRGNNLQL